MKKAHLLIIIFLAILLTGSVVAAILIHNDSVEKQNILNATIQQQNGIVMELNSAIAEMSRTTTVYRTSRDVKSGEVLTSDDIEEIQVGVNLAAGYSTQLEDLLGMTTICDINKNEVIYDTMVYAVELRSDYRTLDVLCDRQPIGFSKGDTVDVRITFPNGQDFLLLSKKLVNDVYGNAVNIVVDEKDILIYRSAEADWARFYKSSLPGSAVQIYCTTYIAAGVQDASKQYYPIQTKLPDKVTTQGSALWVALNNYNLTEADLNDWLQVDRLEFEEALTAYDYYWNDMITYEALQYERTGELQSKATWNGSEITTAEIKFFKDNETAYEKEIVRAFGALALVESELKKIVLYETNRDFVYDHEGGSKAVSDAKIERDNMYIAASNAYAERRTAMIQARAEAKYEYEKKLEQGLVVLPWNDSMFDEKQWENDYSAGVLEFVKQKEEEEEKAKQEAEQGGSFIIVE